MGMARFGVGVYQVARQVVWYVVRYVVEHVVGYGGGYVVWLAPRHVGV